MFKFLGTRVSKGVMLVIYCSVFIIVMYAGIDVIFFFQAEDGIRDYKVTGVQTCALPISCGCRHDFSRVVLSDQAA